MVVADVRNICFSVKSSPLSCRRDALNVSKNDRMEEIGLVRRKSKSRQGILSILLLSFEI